MTATKLAVGTVQFGLPYGVANRSGQVDAKEAKLMLSCAEEAGIDTLDTAIAYGSSEELLGKLGIQQFNIVTKLPGSSDNKRTAHEWVRYHLKMSLQRLNLEQVDGLLLHRPESLLTSEGAVLYAALQAAKDQGLVGKIGVSAYDTELVLAITKKYRIDLVQMPFNLLDRRLVQSGCLMELKNQNIEVHVRSAFLQGLLLMSQDSRPEHFSAWAPIWTQWHNWLETNAVSALRACLSYLLAFPGIDRVVVGADTVQQLKEIIDAANNPVALVSLPNLKCDDQNLINPSIWPQL